MDINNVNGSQIGGLIMLLVAPEWTQYGMNNIVKPIAIYVISKTLQNAFTPFTKLSKK